MWLPHCPQLSSADSFASLQLARYEFKQFFNLPTWQSLCTVPFTVFPITVLRASSNN